MRPDQHKKKKNAEYKKKHGIPNQAKKNDKGKNQVSQRTDESPETSKRNEEAQSNSDSDDDERKDEEERDHGRRQFSRRKIESNWDRYSEQDQDEEYQSNVSPTVSKIGADFQSLLDNTGGPSSHFHFKGEQEWENLNENYEMNSKVGSTIVSVDFEALAQSLREIPLDRRLEIDKKYLEDEPPCAKTKEVQKVKFTATNSVTAPMSANSKQTFSARNVNFSKPNGLSQKTELKGNDGPVKINDKIKSSTTEFAQLSTNHIIHIKETEGTHITEDLDQLLRLETAKGKSDVEVVGKIPQNKENDERRTQDTSKKMDETKEDLEDWLDSILD